MGTNLAACNITHPNWTRPVYWGRRSNKWLSCPLLPVCWLRWLSRLWFLSGWPSSDFQKSELEIEVWLLPWRHSQSHQSLKEIKSTKIKKNAKCCSKAYPRIQMAMSDVTFCLRSSYKMMMIFRDTWIVILTNDRKTCAHFFLFFDSDGRDGNV